MSWTAQTLYMHTCIVQNRSKNPLPLAPRCTGEISVDMLFGHATITCPIAIIFSIFHSN